MFAIWTRYVRPNGTVVRHVFGPYPTRSKAATVLKRMLQDQVTWYGEDQLDQVEAQVTKMVGP